jgi:hypothetical protein
MLDELGSKYLYRPEELISHLGWAPIYPPHPPPQN